MDDYFYYRWGFGDGLYGDYKGNGNGYGTYSGYFSGNGYGNGDRYGDSNALEENIRELNNE
jgi:hypothetical protein